MHTAATTSHAALTGSPRVRATIARETAPSTTMTAQSNLFCMDIFPPSEFACRRIDPLSRYAIREPFFSRHSGEGLGPNRRKSHLGRHFPDDRSCTRQNAPFWPMQQDGAAPFDERCRPRAGLDLWCRNHNASY